MSSIKGPAPAPESFPRAEKLKIGIVHARWNKEVIDALVTGTLESLEKAGVKAEQVAIDSVPGSWELPMGTLKMIKRENVDAVVSIGCVIKGSTMHFEYICDNSLKGLMRVSLDTQVPVILGVLTALDEDQALERAGIGRKKPGHNHGLEWGTAAVEYVNPTLTRQNGSQGAQARDALALVSRLKQRHVIYYEQCIDRSLLRREQVFNVVQHLYITLYGARHVAFTLLQALSPTVLPRHMARAAFTCERAEQGSSFGARSAQCVTTKGGCVRRVWIVDPAPRAGHRRCLVRIFHTWTTKGHNLSPQGAQLRFTVHMRRSATGIGDGRSHIHPRVKNTEVGFAALGVHAAVIDRVKTITVLQRQMTRTASDGDSQ
jgi:6,7-dimethyl-8-ribityllumazine synthase